jgi:hypothetical protein
VASFFIEAEQEKEAAEVDAVLVELKAIREELALISLPCGRVIACRGSDHIVGGFP